MPPRRRNLTRLAARLRARREALRTRPRLYTALNILVLLLAASLAWPFVDAHLQSIAVLDLVANKPVPVLLQHLVTEPVNTTELTITTSQGPVRARLYIPAHHPNAPALMVLHGVHHLGMDEPRLKAFASAMASCGLRVLTPELPGIKDYHVDADTITTIGESAQWLAENTRPPRTGHEFDTPPAFNPVGILGLSFSGGLSLIAASEPQFHPYIKFVFAVGSQDNMARVATYYRTGDDPRPDGTTEFLQPHEYGPLVLEYEHLADFAPAADLPALRQVLRAHLYEDVPAEHAALAALTPAQHAEAESLMLTNSPTTRALLQASEQRHLDYARTVSPHFSIQHLTTPVYLLHGEGDNIIPSAETQWLAADLPPGTVKAELISPVLSHLDLDGTGPTVYDDLRLMHFFALVLHAAESR
jgi:dienelactone hydrolase